MSNNTDRKLTRILFVMLVIGMTLLLVYARNVPYDVSTHDLGPVAGEGEISYGHLGYIQYLYRYHQLPETYRVQYYHPPLFHICSAVVYGIFSHGETDMEAGFEAVQIMNALVACFCMWLTCLIAKKLIKSSKTLIATSALICFCPIWYNIGTCINNDCFATAFMLATILHMLWWMEQHTIKSIAGAGLCLALGILSKTSAILLAPAMAVVFLVELLRNRSEWKRYIVQYSVFAAVCVPLGVSWVVRQMIVFGISPGYIYKLSESSPQYIGDVPLIQRILIPSVRQFSAAVIDFSNSKDYANAWFQTIYTYSFDEGLYNIPNKAVWLLGTVWNGLNAVMLSCTVVGFIAALWRSVGASIKSRAVNSNLFLSLVSLVMFGSYFIYPFQYPFVCSINVRFIASAIMSIFILTGSMFPTNEVDNSRGSKVIEKIWNIILWISAVAGGGIYFMTCL